MSRHKLPPDNLKLILAPMVNQSDLPFRILTRRHGVTLTYTQMWLSERIVHDEAYRNTVLGDLTFGHDEPLSRPVVVQLAGNDPAIMLQAALLLQDHCDAIDINLGCPQDRAKEGHYGGYLLGRKDWPLVEEIVSLLASSLHVPVHTKIRLCNPASDTPVLCQKLAGAGASVIAIHARHVAINHRRAGPAHLQWVARVVSDLSQSGLGSDTAVVSNGNVDVYVDCQQNLELTGAAGLMIGEALLKHPALLEQTAQSAGQSQKIALEYLSLCRKYPVALIYTIHQHIKTFFASSTTKLVREHHTSRHSAPN
ncbi:hypothetical protein FRB99_002654 [Tulasnella sp. 403]|nr:hypothetical protein FRB99_002654 [Tulasnella sp. 403]